MLHRNPPPYPEHTVFCYNLRRVCNSDLVPDARVDSLKVVTRMRPSDQTMFATLLEALKQTGNSRPVHYALLEFLVRNDYPPVAEYALKVLDDSDMPGDLRDAILGWLMTHGRPDVLAPVAKLWAREESTTSLNEPRYRQIVERITGKKWEDALLDGINSSGFYARGSALEILAARMDERTLRGRIESMHPATVAMLALREFIRQLDYIPRTREDFVTATAIYSTRGPMLADASRLYRRWSRESGYKFAIRDFHLLSRLARDPLRKDMSRADLIIEVSRSATYRVHVRRPSQSGESGQANSLASQVNYLTMADLWNLYLIYEMLARPRVQLALRAMADYDLADTRSAWGGLVLYENGQAEAKLYRPVVEGAGDDMRYKPSQHLEAEARDALCWFHAHFDRIRNVGRAGPDEQDVREAKENGFYGMVLTSLDENTFAAHYYNPDGIVVSLGNFPFQRRTEPVQAP